MPINDRRPEVRTITALDPEIGWLEMDVDVLADVALGEDPNALVAVMWTVLNRQRSPVKWDCTPYEPLLEQVVQSGRAYGTVRGGRFLPAWHQDPKSRWGKRQMAWRLAQRIAWGVVLGLSDDPTGGATHFNRRGTWKPPWAPKISDSILLGSHYFYKSIRLESSPLMHHITSVNSTMSPWMISSSY